LLVNFKFLETRCNPISGSFS